MDILWRETLDAYELDLVFSVPMDTSWDRREDFVLYDNGGDAVGSYVLWLSDTVLRMEFGVFPFQPPPVELTYHALTEYLRLNSAAGIGLPDGGWSTFTADP